MESSSHNRILRESTHFDKEYSINETFVGFGDYDYLSHPCIPENNYLLQRMNGKFDGLRVLDIGCGQGEATAAFAKRGARVSGVDVSKKALEVASTLAANLGVQSDFHMVDSYGLPFKEGEFDLVYGNGVLHHLDLRLGAFEIRRVLKKGGLGFFIEPTTGNPLIAVYRKLAKSKRSLDEHPLTKDDFHFLSSVFSHVEMIPFQVTTLLVFLKMFLVEWKNPNTHSYWREPVIHAAQYQGIYRWATRLDERFRRSFPKLFDLLCWNKVILLHK